MEPTDRPATAAERPVESGPRVTVHPGAERHLATEHWLLATLPEEGRERARREWLSPRRFTMLPLGGLLAAVKVPARVVLALSGGQFPSTEIDHFLNQALDGGPVICDVDASLYYFLVPVSVPRTWDGTDARWRAQDVDCLGRGAHLGVPALSVEEYDPRTRMYWSVPMPWMATTCQPLAVARLVAAGVHALTGKAAADA